MVRDSRAPSAALLLFVLVLAATLGLSANGPGQQSAPAKPASVFPGGQWEHIDRPESAGFSSARLNALRTWLGTQDTTGLVVAVGGRSLFEYGNITELSYLASCRKSVLAMLYGRYVENGAIPLGKTLRDLQMDDVGGLLPAELEATVEHLLTARSGIYHPASNAGDDTASAPPRGPQRPGWFFLYNNWDFNAAGAVFEKLTGRDIYDALETDLARPIGMQDFSPSSQKKSGDLSRSQYPAYHMWLSARDMARVGLLMARGGSWAGTQVIPRDWVRRITSLVTPFHEMNPPYLRSLGTGERWGYGYLWWVWDGPSAAGTFGEFSGAYSAKGAGGQFITVLPQFDMVVAHKTNTDRPPASGPSTRRRTVNNLEYAAILRILIAARCPGGRCG